MYHGVIHHSAKEGQVSENGSITISMYFGLIYAIKIFDI